MLSNLPKIIQLVRGRAGIQAQIVWLQSMSSLTTVSALPFWKDDRELACVAHPEERVCTCMHTHARVHTHTLSIPAMGGKSQDRTPECLCVNGRGLCSCGSPGRPVSVCTRALPSSLPALWFPQSVCSAASGVELRHRSLHPAHLDQLLNPVEGP